MVPSRRHAVLLAVLGTLGLTACGAIIGVKDIFLEADGGPSTGDASTDTSADAPVVVPGEGGGNDSGGPLRDAEAGIVDSGPPCIDTLADPKNCGACGHDCFGSTCDAGSCGIGKLTSTSNVGYVVVDSTNLYYTDEGLPGVYKMPKLGPPAMRTALATSPQDQVNEIAVDAKSVYWAVRYNKPDGGPGGIYRADIDGGAAEVVAAGQEYSDSLIADKNRLYWIDGNTSMGRNIKTSGLTADSGATTVDAGVDSGDPTTLAIVGSSLYVTSESAGTLDRCTLPGCTGKVTLLTAPGSVSGIAINASRIFYTYNNRPGGSVSQMALDGASPDIVANNQDQPHTIALDASNVYWLNAGPRVSGSYSDGSLSRCKLTNGVADCSAGITVLATNQSYVHSLVVDDKAIYWVSGGNLMRLAK